MQKCAFTVPLAACLILSACSAKRIGEPVALNGTGLVYRGGRFQVIDVSRHETYYFASSPALERWTSSDHLFRDKDANCQILVFDVRGRATVIQAANARKTPHAVHVRADELTLTPVNKADAEKRVRDTGIEALIDRRVCASA